MKNIFAFTAVAAILVLASGCKDRVQPDLSGGDDGIVLTLKPTADIYNVSIAGDASWEVTEHPKWISPFSGQGAAGEQLQIFVEDNTDEGERSGRLTLMTDNGEILYTLRQQSVLTDDENAAYTISDNLLQLTYGVGQGVDVFKKPSQGKYNTVGAIVDPVKLLAALEKAGEQDAYVAETLYSSQTETYSGTSVSTIASKLSVGAGLGVEVTGFEANLNAKFSQSSSSTMNKAYALREIKHIVGSRYLRDGILRHFAESGDSVFTSSFYAAVDRVKKNPTAFNISRLINLYGTHVVTYGGVGGELELGMEMSSSETLTEMNIEASLNIVNDIVSGDAKVDVSNEMKEINKNTRISLTIYGGNSSSLTISPGTSFEDVMAMTSNYSNLDSWVQDIKTGESVFLVDIQTCPIYELIDDEATRTAVKSYIVDTYQKKMLGHGAPVSIINGFSTAEGGLGYLNIPETGVRLEYYSENVPEITSSGKSTIIYSGTIGDMNYDCGFFIGNGTQRPGKLYRERNGKFTYEPLPDYESAGPVTELYVNARGDVTLGSTGDTKEFSELTFKPFVAGMEKNYMPSTHIGTGGLCGDINTGTRSGGPWNAVKYRPATGTYYYGFAMLTVSLEEILDGNVRMAIQMPSIASGKYGEGSSAVPLTVDELKILCLYDSYVHFLSGYTKVLTEETVRDYDGHYVTFTPPAGTKYVALLLQFLNNNSEDYRSERHVTALANCIDGEQNQLIFPDCYGLTEKTPRWR